MLVFEVKKIFWTHLEKNPKRYSKNWNGHCFYLVKSYDFWIFMVFRLWSKKGEGGCSPNNPLLPKLLQTSYLTQSISDTNSGHTSMESVMNYIGCQKGMTWIAIHFKLLTMEQNKKAIYFFSPIIFFQKVNFCNPSPLLILSIPVGRQVTKYHINPQPF